MLLLALNLDFSTPLYAGMLTAAVAVVKRYKIVLGHLPGKIGFDFTSLLLFIALLTRARDRSRSNCRKMLLLL